MKECLLCGLRGNALVAFHPLQLLDIAVDAGAQPREFIRHFQRVHGGAYWTRRRRLLRWWLGR